MEGEGKRKRKQQQNRDAVVKCWTLIKGRAEAVSEGALVCSFVSVHYDKGGDFQKD